jgi:hypothetical protein
MYEKIILKWIINVGREFRHSKYATTCTVMDYYEQEYKIRGLLNA